MLTRDEVGIHTVHNFCNTLIIFTSRIVSNSLLDVWTSSVLQGSPVS